MASTTITTNADALKRAARALCAHDPSHLTVNGVLNTLSAAIAGPGKSWGFITGAPNGWFVQPGLSLDQQCPQPAACGDVWVLSVEKGQSFATSGEDEAKALLGALMQGMPAVSAAWGTLVQQGSVCVQDAKGAMHTITLARRALHAPGVAIRPLYNAPSQSVERAMMEALKVAVLARKTIIITGATGMGKTTLLNIMLGWMDARDRVRGVAAVVGHDLNEAAHANMSVTIASHEDHGAAIYRTLAMRPDRLVVDEVNNAKTLYAFLDASGLGVRGSLCTMHAGSPSAVINRLQSMLREVGVVADDHLLAGVDMIVHMGGSGARLGVRSVNDVVAGANGKAEAVERVFMGTTD